MNFKPYAIIRDELYGLNKRDVYRELLQTIEWRDFRDRIISCNGSKCHNCGKEDKEFITKERWSNEEWLVYRDEVLHYNSIIKTIDRKFPTISTDILLGSPQEKDQILNSIKEELSKEDFDLYLPNWPSVFKKNIPVNLIRTGQIHIQLHHKFYFHDRLPWDYKPNHVLPLCQYCHAEVHRVETIYTYKDESMKFRSVFKNCGKCKGTGYLPEYDYWLDGVCFDCGGLGFDPNDSHQWEAVD